MLKGKPKRSGLLRHLSTARSLTGITALLALKKSNYGQMAQYGLSRSSLTSEKGNKH
jgi:hypothetical protein